MTQAELIQLARSTAVAHGLDPALVCSVVEQESGWDTWAIRYEPGFYAHYIEPHKPESTESRAEAFSWGLMQCMGAVARDAGHHGHIAQLCDPSVGIEIGCRILRSKLDLAKGDVRKALLFWNGGGDPSYPNQVLARKAKYE